MKFSALGLNDELLKAISYMGYEEATPIQEKVIPYILENRDLIACAQTGTGKTGAFVLPILNMLIGKKERHVSALIIVPTRELAIQIEQQIQGFSYFVSAGSIAIYGGGDGIDWEEQKKAMIKGVDIVVATPGKLLSHLKTGDASLSQVKHLVLDEADRMLDMGFIGDIRAILSFLPKTHQTLMFSATMHVSIRQLAQKILHNPVEIALSVSKPAESVDQKVCLVHEEQKVRLIKHILDDREDYESILIFTSTRKKVSEIVAALHRQGFPARGISSDLDQEKREEVLGKFRARRIRILVATNVMSRGIDVKEINLVINYDLPRDAEDYVHRVGRTARVNVKGEAITLVIPREIHKLKEIERLIEAQVPLLQPPEELGPVPQWDEKVPASVPGRRFYGRKGEKHRPFRRRR